MEDQQWIHRIALSMLKGVGPVHARELVAYAGGVDPLFTDPRLYRSLEKVPGVGPKILAALKDSEVLVRAEKELAYVRRERLRMLFYLDADYPQRLKHASDPPALLFVKGAGDLDADRCVAVVGTRSPSEHGKRSCEELVTGLKAAGVTIISGLAYGIDITAHRAALRNDMPTFAAVAHGLDRLYPGEHQGTARQMLPHGGLVTEQPSNANFVPGNFPARNRIIAGLADCTVVVESAGKGGSLITADIANSYDRDVMAFPGRATDARSEGCNDLIKRNKAALITGAGDLLQLMGWQEKPGKKARQIPLFKDLGPEELLLMNILQERDRVDIDELCARSKMTQSKVAALLLELEFSGAVRALPGKIYEPA
ncbi:MAG: DNA-processing protein DprA [Flavobacteriales bacterium]|nr:DNA-processing protein DprA [Flavobacteriales bacterium]